MLLAKVWDGPSLRFETSAFDRFRPHFLISAPQGVFLLCEGGRTALSVLEVKHKIHKSYETKVGLFEVQWLSHICYWIILMLPEPCIWIIWFISACRPFMNPWSSASSLYRVHSTCGGRPHFGRRSSKHRADGIRWCRRQLHGQNGQPTVKRLGSKGGEVAIGSRSLESVVTWCDMIFALALSKWF